MESLNCNIVAAHIINCKDCQKIVQKFFAQRAGSTITKAKIKSSRINGLKGGRPRK